MSAWSAGAFLVTLQGDREFRGLRLLVSPKDVAPAALASTFANSIAGVITFLILANPPRRVGREWGIGLTLGVGGVIAATAGPESNLACPRTPSDDSSAGSSRPSVSATPGSPPNDTNTAEPTPPRSTSPRSPSPAVTPRGYGLAGDGMGSLAR
jgi:hypothetical protein